MPLGVNLGSLTKVLKCAKDDDVCTLKATDDADVLNLTYEGKSEFCCHCCVFDGDIDEAATRRVACAPIDSDRIAEYDMKLMDIDADQLGIPDTEYDARVTMPSTEFGRIVRDLAQLGESVRIEVSKEGVRFAAEGEAANGSVLLKQTEAARRKYAEYGKKPKEEDEEEEASGSKKKAKANGKVKKEPTDGDEEMANGEDVEEDDGGEFKKNSDDEGEDEKDDSDEEEEGSRKRKKAQQKVFLPSNYGPNKN